MYSHVGEDPTGYVDPYGDKRTRPKYWVPPWEIIEKVTDSVYRLGKAEHCLELAEDRGCPGEELALYISCCKEIWAVVEDIWIPARHHKLIGRTYWMRSCSLACSETHWPLVLKRKKHWGTRAEDLQWVEDEEYRDFYKKRR